MTLGQKLQELRQDNDITQSQLAKKLYVTRQTVSRWEQNRTIPSIETLNQIAHLYQTTVNNLVSDDNYEINSSNMDNLKSEKYKVNLLALSGIIWFNLLFGIAIYIVIISLVLSFWVILVSFILSPFVLLISTISGLQLFAFWQLITSVLLCLLGMKLFPISKKLTCQLFNQTKRYLRWNKHLIYK